jgi:polysaccharide biosynthesis transport protein
MNALVESWQILKRRWLPATMTIGTVVGAASIYNMLQQPIYEAKGKISFKDQKQAIVLAAPRPTDRQSSPIQRLKSLPVAQRAVAGLRLSRTPAQVLENIRVQKVAGQDLLEVSYRDTDAKRAAQVATTLMEDYLAQDANLRRQEAITKQAGLENQLAIINSETKVATSNLQNFKAEFKIADLQNEKKSLVGAINNLQEEAQKANIQKNTLESKLLALNKSFDPSSQTILRSILISPSPSMQQILVALQGVEEKLAMENNKSLKNNRVVEDLTSQQTVLKGEVQKESQQSLLSSNRFRSQAFQWKQSGISEDLQFNLVQLETQRDAIDKRIAVLNSSIKKGQSQIAAFSPSENKVRLLEQTIAKSQDKYEKLASQLKSAQTVVRQALPSAQIISPVTVSDQPIFAPRGIDPFWSVLSGLALGGAVAMGLDSIDKRLKNVATVQRVTQYPILGYIPNFPQWTATKTSNLLTSKNNRPEHEPFQTLQSSLNFLENQGAAQVIVSQIIVISSAVHREGKSTLAAHLALTAAQTGQRVLLVDADLRRPQQHQFWQVSNSIGLTNILLNENQFPESIIEVAENLGLLPAGSGHDQPSVLFNSSTMIELFTQWFSLYDLVVIDAPPLNHFEEAIILSKMADGLMLIVNPQIVELADFQNAQNLLQQAQQHVLGVVINRVEYSEYKKLTLTQAPRADFGNIG